MAVGESLHWPLSRAAAGNSMASAARAAMGSFMKAPVVGVVGQPLSVGRKVLKSLKRAVKLPKIEFLDWLSSSEGPAPAASLRAVRTRARTWIAIWSRRVLLRQFSFPKPRRYLYVPASPRTKISAILRYARDHKLDTFVETGTYLGDTVAAVAPSFNRCFTIEMSAALHALSSERLGKFGNVRCVLGNSSSALPDIVLQLGRPALFWLDAHASGGETENTGKGPLFAELRAIYSDKTTGHVVLIDDARGHNIDAIRSFCAPHALIDVRNDIVRLTPIIR
jgi:hypothetical protein